MAKTIFGKIIAAVLDVFISNFPEFISKLFKKIPADIQKKIEVIISTVDQIEQFLNSPAADFLTSIIPSETDETFKKWLQEALGKIPFDILSRKELTPADKHVIASLLTKQLLGTSFGQAAITTEVVYQKLKKNATI